MLTLTFNYKKPQTGDRGGGVNGFWVALEDNIQQLNDHTHNGTNSSKLASDAVTSTSQTISAAGWSASGTGYRQLVTMPTGITYDAQKVEFRLDTAEKSPVLLTTEKASPNTYYVYCNDNTADLVAYY